MAVQKKDTNAGYVKKEFAVIGVIIALVAGFLGGLVYSAFQAVPGPGSKQAGVAQSQFPQQAAPVQNFNPDEANRILSLEREVATNPGNVGAWVELGNLYFDTEQFAKAITAYEKSLTLRPGDPNVLTDLGVMYRRNGQPEKALENFDKAVQFDPGHQQSRFNKGVVLRYDFNDREAAIKVWEELLKLNPSFMGPNGQPLRETMKDL